MSKLTIANFRKTIHYFKKNGLRETFLAALERLLTKEAPYVYEAPSAEVLDAQREKANEGGPLFSILVPAYRTDERYLRAMLASVLAQSYPHFELIVADATEDDSVGRIVKEYRDARVRYLHLLQNRGISENTNEALEAASGSYIGLLDHDDMLTPDALFQAAAAIARAKEKGVDLRLLYSDEDKCDESGTYYFEHHKKMNFNLELFLTNNYICHFMVMEAALMKRLGFRKAFDGSQDYDMALRAIGAIFAEYPARQQTAAKDASELPSGGAFASAVKAAAAAWQEKKDMLLPVAAEEQICHIPRVLYHWRCHENSTAANPQSKDYAYDASRRAASDFLKSSGIKGQAFAMGHMGYGKIRYEGGMFKQGSGVGIKGGRMLGSWRRVVGGIYTEKGKCPYQGLFAGFGGYMNRAVLAQEAAAVDIRCMEIQPNLLPFVRETVGKAIVSMNTRGETKREKKAEETAESLYLDAGGLLCGWKQLGLTDAEYRSISVGLCRAVREAGYRIVWEPALTKKKRSA